MGSAGCCVGSGMSRTQIGWVAGWPLGKVQKRVLEVVESVDRSSASICMEIKHLNESYFRFNYRFDDTVLIIENTG